ncbi:LacI family transcriptional regulator [Ruminococcaceae bacterium OttesenSCG-928-L11]|nr:LacI family transcriptional regulator [Ruminococcaceae bacterium OttesenSCG-928-L11]
MATIKDIARETGLGLATISKYLNGGTVREKNRLAIEAAVDKLGYTVNELARSLKTSRSRTIGVVIPELGNAFVTTIITEMEDILRKNGYSVIVCDCRTDAAQEREAVRFLLQKRVDGILNMPVSRDGTHLDSALEAGVPVVLIDRMIDRLAGKVHSILVDNAAGASAAVSRLIDAGHRHIGVILGPQGVFTTAQRHLGYSRAMTRNGLTPDAAFVVYGDYTVQGGYEGMRRLLELPGLTAVFVTNYEMTLGAIIAGNELSVKIPERLSLIGFDNLQLSQVIQPRLTIVTQPLKEIGEAAAGIFLEALEADAPEIRELVLNTGLLEGDSVGTISEP